MSCKKTFSMKHQRCVMITAVAVLGLSARQIQSVSAETKQEYQIPPKAIASLIDAPPTPAVSVSPDKQWMLFMQRANLAPISEVSQPELRIAGIRINPRTNGRSRTSHYESLTLKTFPDGPERKIKGIPSDARIGRVSWSPDATKIAFINTRPNGVELWVADAAKATARKLTEPRLMTASGGSYSWVSDSSTLICRFVPKDRGLAPAEPQVPAGPTLQENIGRKSPARTYQDLLKNAHDEALFDYYLTSNVVTVTLDGKVTPISSKGLVLRADPSPDGKYVLMETIRRPYSYLVPMSRFPKRIEVADMSGQSVKLVADLPLADDVPVAFGSVRKGPRSVGWRADSASTLYWAEAQDGGDAGAKAEIRDKVFVLASPFKSEPIELVSLPLRYSNVMWGHDKLALAMEWWWKTRKLHVWKLDPSKPGSTPELMIDRSFEDRYSDPGNPVFKQTAAGTSVLMTANQGRTLFMRGNGASPEGDRPFLDTFNMESKETKRLWRSEAPYYEYAVDIIDPEKMTVLTRRESVSEPPNYYLRTMGSDALTSVTKFPHPTPELANVYKEQIRYEREDGVKLTATLYLPPGKKPKDGPWPTLLWAYPQEFKSADAAGQVTDSPYRFVRTSSHSPLLWLVHGYAVIDDPTMPIVGEGDEEPNDTFVDQLVSGAKAAVDEAVRRGIADPDRIGVGGHSYGAFMTANLLVRSDLFRAGIARSGAYNRTLTPFGFQSEERSYWEAPEIYYTMSPFMHADKVNEPILLIHGEADNNSGTFPVQSKRFYSALKGHGATTRLVMLPHESHGYRARESIMHMAWEMTQWLDTYVKNAKPREK